jgi:hypothetical protein
MSNDITRMAEAARTALEQNDAAALATVWLEVQGLEWVDSIDELAADTTAPEVAAQKIVTALADLADDEGYAPMFAVDGAASTLRSLIDANSDDAGLCLWALSCGAGEHFPALVSCTRTA